MHKNLVIETEIDALDKKLKYKDFRGICGR